MTIKLDKSSRRKKQPKPIQNNKPAEPEEKFDFDKFKTSTNGKVKIAKRRGPGHPRKNKGYGMMRVSDTARDMLNAYKQAVGQPSQGDAIIYALSKNYQGIPMTKQEKEAFVALLKARGLLELLHND